LNGILKRLKRKVLIELEKKQKIDSFEEEEG